MVKSNSTEAQIILAARAVFVRKGFDGARMQEIADEAGINKALLHYYFRSKDNLFTRVFEEVFEEVINSAADSLFANTDFEHFLEAFVMRYISILKSKPYLPQFVLHEVNRNPERMVELIRASAFDKDKLMGFIREAEEKGVIEYYHPYHLITNILALCVFPFIARPIIQGFMMDGNEKAFEDYIEERPEQVLHFIKRSIFLERGKAS